MLPTNCLVGSAGKGSYTKSGLQIRKLAFKWKHRERLQPACGDYLSIPLLLTEPGAALGLYKSLEIQQKRSKVGLTIQSWGGHQYRELFHL